jgi:hypothetical protein
MPVTLPDGTSYDVTSFGAATTDGATARRAIVVAATDHRRTRRWDRGEVDTMLQVSVPPRVAAQ